MSTAVKLNQKYTYADYLTWPDDERWEIIEGVPFAMGPAPAPDHQRILLSLVRIIASYLDKKPCEAFVAPFDVRFSTEADDSVDTVVQPDISVICDKQKIDKRGAVGAPDIVVEILSPSTSYKDETEKLKLYEKHGVREYWIVNPAMKTIQVFVHDGEKFGKPGYYTVEESIQCIAVEGLEVRLVDIFPEE